MPNPTAPSAAPGAFARAVVFGACGFLGSEVARQLLAAGTQVLGIDTRPWPGPLPAGYAHNDRGASDLAGALGEAAGFLTPAGGPAAFFHLAGLADAGACQRDPALAQKLNVDLVAQALLALRHAPCAFVFPSTGIVYGDGLPRPAREDDPLLPSQEYARGKIAAEGLIRAACAPGGPADKPLRGVIARLSNLYGPGGGENTVLGRILAQARRGEPLQVWDESPVRDFLYVTDAAQGLIRLGLRASSLEGSEGCLVANLSSGTGTRISALLDLGAELFHTSRLPQEREPDLARPVSSLVLDNSRLAALTGWRPATPLTQGLQRCFQNAHTPNADN